MHCCIIYVLQAHTHTHTHTHTHEIQSGYAFFPNYTVTHLFTISFCVLFYSIYIVTFCVFANTGRHSVLQPLWNLFLDSYFEVLMLNVFYEDKITQVEE